MVTMGLDADNALEVIRKARPDVQYVFSVRTLPTSLVYTAYSRRAPICALSTKCILMETVHRPNDGFMHQLDIFHQASYKVSKHDKETRLFYLERVVNEVMSTS